jgi:hypothetical protein
VPTFSHSQPPGFFASAGSVSAVSSATTCTPCTAAALTDKTGDLSASERGASAPNRRSSGSRSFRSRNFQGVLAVCADIGIFYRM